MPLSRGNWQMVPVQQGGALDPGFRRLLGGTSSSLGERVYTAMKHDIVTGILQPGMPISEKELTVRYHGSRTPIREAALRLQKDNLLRITHRGYFVPEITLDFINELYECRAVLEATCAELATKREPDARVLESLGQLAATRLRAGDRSTFVRFVEADTIFHIGIATLTKNQLLVRAVADSRAQMERVMYAALNINYYGVVATREHREILKAISQRDARRARKAMHDHILGSKDKVLAIAKHAPLTDLSF